jgi:Flp pilus assembly protein CpaB
MHVLFREKAPGPLRTVVPLAGAAVVFASSVTPEPVLVSGLVLAGVVALSVVLPPERRAIEVEGPGQASPDPSAEQGASV